MCWKVETHLTMLRLCWFLVKAAANGVSAQVFGHVNLVSAVSANNPGDIEPPNPWAKTSAFSYSTLKKLQEEDQAIQQVLPFLQKRQQPNKMEREKLCTNAKVLLREWSRLRIDDDGTRTSWINVIRVFPKPFGWFIPSARARRPPQTLTYDRIWMGDCMAIISSPKASASPSLPISMKSAIKSIVPWLLTHSSILGTMQRDRHVIITEPWFSEFYHHKTYLEAVVKKRRCKEDTEDSRCVLHSSRVQDLLCIEMLQDSGCTLVL